MNGQYNTGVQAGFATVLTYFGRERAETWLTRTLIHTSGWDGVDEYGLSALLGGTGIPCAVAGVIADGGVALYRRIRVESLMALSLMRSADQDTQPVWGMMYRRPCRCDGLLIFDPRSDRPRVAVPHRETFLGPVVVAMWEARVNYPDLVNLPKLFT